MSNQIEDKVADDKRDIMYEAVAGECYKFARAWIKVRERLKDERRSYENNK